MNKEIAAVFDQRLADYKQMVILRQEECTQIAEVCDGENEANLDHRGNSGRR
jgi:hypothetical protein